MKQSSAFPVEARRSRLPAVLAIAAALAAAGPLAAQDAMLSVAERDVVAVVETFFDGMLQRDAAKLRSTVSPNAVLWTVQNRDGQSSINALPIEQFITSVTTRQGEPLNEQIHAPRVELDAGTAHVWTFYTLHVGERFSHCGFDSFQLLRMPDGWKIVSVADTRRTENCEPPGG